MVQTRHFDEFADAGCTFHQKQRSLFLKTLQAYAKHLKNRVLLRACKFSAEGSLILLKKQLHLDEKPSASAIEAVQGGSDPQLWGAFWVRVSLFPKN